uniref:Uncharacterized protein n=1 Tax=Anguilla anguilla TaxID=7936 RepID=A0A0E9VQC8_ANGAN
MNIISVDYLRSFKSSHYQYFSEIYKSTFITLIHGREIITFICLS